MNMTQPSALEPSAILAVDAGGTVLKAALVDRQGRLIAGSAYRLPVDSAGDRASVEETYIQLSRRGLEEARSRGLTLAGIGVSIPGPFDYEQGLCLMTHKYQSIYKVPMRPWFEAGAGPVPVRFVHDSTAFMLGAFASFGRTPLTAHPVRMSARSPNWPARATGWPCAFFATPVYTWPKSCTTSSGIRASRFCCWAVRSPNLPTCSCMS
jgi:hypothetical protein